jgi:hypothetical protein
MDSARRKRGLRRLRSRGGREDAFQLLFRPALGTNAAQSGRIDGLARGWGRSEEDLPAEKEAAKEAERESGRPVRPPAEEAARHARLHAIELSLARIADQLSKTVNPDRRRALESARAQLEEQRKRT